MKYCFLLLFGFLMACQPPKNITVEKQQAKATFTKCTTKPCQEKDLAAFIKKNMVYPNKALQKKQEGTVRVEFEVNEVGKKSNFKILDPIGYGLGEEAVRLIRLTGDWEAAKNKRGKPLKTKVVVPITFKVPYS